MGGIGILDLFIRNPSCNTTNKTPTDIKRLNKLNKRLCHNSHLLQKKIMFVVSPTLLHLFLLYNSFYFVLLSLFPKLVMDINHH